MSVPKNQRRAKIREERWRQQDGCCHYCQIPMTLQEATTEHIVPKAFGGTDGFYNLVAVCSACNNERGHGLQVCKCRRCQRALEVFTRMRRGQRQPVQNMVYVGDKSDTADLLVKLRLRRDALAKTLDGSKLDDRSRFACEVAAKTIDQVIGMLVTPKPRDEPGPLHTPTELARDPDRERGRQTFSQRPLSTTIGDAVGWHFDPGR